MKEDEARQQDGQELPRRHDSCENECTEFLDEHKNKDLRDGEEKKGRRQGESHKFWKVSALVYLLYKGTLGSTFDFVFLGLRDGRRKGERQHVGVEFLVPWGYTYVPYIVPVY